MNSADYILTRSSIEAAEEWRSWGKKLPWLKFKPEWEVLIIPPFLGALTRFAIRNDTGKQVSVYFDGYAKLGLMYEGETPIPYFEAYPIDGNTRRYLLSETDQMMTDIEQELK